MRRFITTSLILALLASIASGIPTDITRPRTALLADNKFLALDSPTVITLYDYDGTPLHKFDAGDAHDIDLFLVTADQEHLLIISKDGSMELDEIESGDLVWLKLPYETAMEHVITDACFSGDDGSFIITDGADVMVWDTQTGKRMGVIAFKDGGILTPDKVLHTQAIQSVSLSFDGSTGVLIATGAPNHGNIFVFVSADGAPQETGWNGARIVRYSSDGSFIAMASGDTYGSQSLRIVNVTTKPPTTVDVGSFSWIRNVRPTRDGKFLIIADGKPVDRQQGPCVGYICDPATSQLTELWSIKNVWPTEFDPDTLIGITANDQFVTTLLDLKTGSNRLVMEHGVVSAIKSIGALKLAEWSGAVLLIVIFAFFVYRRVIGY